MLARLAMVASGAGAGADSDCGRRKAVDPNLTSAQDGGFGVVSSVAIESKIY